MLDEFPTRLDNFSATIYFLVVTAFLLIREYSKIEGYRKLKILHFITAIFLLWHSSSFFQDIFILFNRHKRELLEFKNGLNQIDQVINYINHIYGTILNCILFIITIGIVGRMERARTKIIRLILWMIPSSTISIYIG